MKQQTLRSLCVAGGLYTLAVFLPASATALDISTLGTSITAGNRWQPVVQQMLEGCGLGPVHIGNFGRAGQTIVWGLDHVGPAVQAKPDILIVEFAINDALFDKGTSPAEAERLTRLLISTAKRESPSTRIYLLITNDAQGQQAEKRPELKAHYESYRKLSLEQGVGLIDTESLWHVLGNRALRDDLHPTNEGYKKILAPAVVAALAPNCR